ncbi:TIGR01777 family oxidoreductase [uncultured Thermosynechococcus sp.]|uniref:thylakoid membrane protein ThyD n=1 Tax=uncultured Thermosynechococcus sp. TaxID=436945 RepID=UPI00261F3EB9|nr:TIGR01777 family oxidoreductase [uncultured Thermosynechococcus sp.]
MKVVVTGATGFVGQQVVKALSDRGDRVVALVRSPARAAKQLASVPRVECIGYTPKAAGDWFAALEGADAVINLAGEPLANGRWTPQRKQEIYESRVVGTRQLVQAIAQCQQRPQVLVSTSAIGYYGTSETETFVETHAAGTDFLAKVCVDWEAAAQGVTDLGVRLVILRFGIVLGEQGALAKLLLPFQLYLGGPLGSGQQWFSWIHQQDLVRLILTAVDESKMQGVYNATAPEPLTMADFCRVLGEVMQRPSWLPVPAPALQLLLGEGADVVLKGQRVLPERTLAMGFQFEYPNAKAALTNLLKPRYTGDSR